VTDDGGDQPARHAARDARLRRRALRRRRRRRNLSSVAGRKARPATNVCAATKHGVTGWSDALRQELLEHDVRVICVEPGVVATELPEHISHSETREEAEALYQGRSETLTAHDVASLIVYAVTAPERVSINEVLLRPLRQVN
jgi:NADP-dependent 3-hydroxy acid dehydrogenase YdfG